jgi:serine/threonine protein kinase
MQEVSGAARRDRVLILPPLHTRMPPSLSPHTQHPLQSLRGHFPHRMIKHHVRACETLGIPSHFDGDLHFKRNVLGACAAGRQQGCGARRAAVVHGAASHPWVSRPPPTHPTAPADPVTRAPLTKLVDVTAPLEDLGAKLASHRSPDDDRRSLASLRDLLEKMLVLDPAKRIGVREALAHPFIKGGTGGTSSAAPGSHGGGGAASAAATGGSS